MKLKNLKIVTLFIAAGSMLFGTGCLKKNNTTYEDFSNLQDFVVLTAGPSGSSSVKAAYNRGSDTVTETITVDLASAKNLSSPVTVTIAVDPTALTAYNTANGTSYTALPTANYKLLSTSVTIPAGQHYAQTTLQVFTKGLDPATSYMTPISIIDASGKKLSSNLNTLYFYTIGNPLAGSYAWSYRRWSGTTDTTTANNGGGSDQVVSISPLGPTSLLFPEGYLDVFVDGSAGITLTFTNNNGVLSNFQGFLSTTYQNEITDPNGFGGSIVTSSVLVGYQIVGNASTHYAGSTFRFYTSIKNSSGGIRTLMDTFVKQ